MADAIGALTSGIQVGNRRESIPRVGRPLPERSASARPADGEATLDHVATAIAKPSKTTAGIGYGPTT